MDDFLREVSECLTNQDRQRKEKELRSRIQHGDVQWFLDLSRNIYNSTNPSRAVAFQMCCNVFRDLYQPLDGVLRKEVETVALFRFRASVLQCLHMSFRDTVMPTSRYGHTTIWNTPEGESQWLSSMFRRRRSTAVDARMMADGCADWSCKTQRCGRCGRLLSKGSGDWCAVSMVRVEGLPDATSMVCEPCLQEWRRSATFLCAFFGAASIHALEVNRLRVVGPLWKDAVVLLQHEYRRGARRFFTSTISTFPPYVYQVLVGSRSMMTTREEPRRVVHREMILLRARCMVQLAVESTHAFCSSLTTYEEFLGDLQGCAAADEPPNDDHELCTPGCRHMKTFYFLVKLMEYLSQVLQRLGDHVTTLTTLRHLRAEYLRLVPRQPLHERLMVALLILHILRGRLSNEVETVWWSMLRAVTQESVAVGFLVVALTPANDAEPQSWPELESIRVSLPIYARICRGVFTQADGSAVLLHPFRDEVVHVQLCGDEVPNKGPKALPATREVQFEVTSATGPTKRISFVFKNKSVRNDLVACALWKFVDELCCPAECRDDSPAYGVLHLGEEMGMMEKAPGVDMKNLTSYDQLLRSPEHRQNYQVSFTESILLNHVLGVCDRHTENIRLSPKGWIYHIDYEYLLDRKKPTSETVTMASTVRIDIDAIARIAKFCNRSTEETRRTIYGQVYQWITLLEPHVALFVDLLCCTPDYVDERLQVEESIQRRFFWSLSNHLAKMELVTTLMQSEGRHRLRDRVRAVGQAVNQQSSNLMSSALSLFRWPSSLSSS